MTCGMKSGYIMTNGDLANIDKVINKIDWYIRKTRMEIEKGGLCD